MIRITRTFPRACAALLAALLIAASCKEGKPAQVVTPWGEVLNDTVQGGFSVGDIMAGGELIILTLTGPDSYYDYHGRQMGTQYLLCERFAQKLGVSLRVEVCKDTAEMIERLANDDADLIAYMLDRDPGEKGLIYCGAAIDSLGVQWAVSGRNRELADSLDSWYRPGLLAEVRQEEERMLSASSVKRHVYSPFKNRERGIISSYDGLFKKYAPTVRWDWRLMAAQCYQESCFDPKARSWAGARGLMQIMPGTAAHLGLPMESINEPEANISAAARYIRELSELLEDVPSFAERQLFVLAAYNGGLSHIRDAMALAAKNGRDGHRWKDVAPFVLGLQRPAFYNDPVVRNGYMRGAETVDYVDRIRERYAQYSGVSHGGAGATGGPAAAPARPAPGPNGPYTPQKAKKKHKYGN